MRNVDGAALLRCCRHELVHQAFGIHPAQRVQPDPELPSAVGHDHRLGQQAVVADRTPECALNSRVRPELVWTSYPASSAVLEVHTSTVAQRYGISAETVRKWHKRGVADCLDRSTRPHQLPWKATEEERAIDRCSQSDHLAVKDDETEKSAIAFLREAAAAFLFRLTRVLTDNGSCFTPGFAKACTELGAQYRHTKPRTPQTNGMVERFNGRISSEVLAINVYPHRALEQLLRGFNSAYNARRQRVLDGRMPNQVTAERLTANPNSRTPHRMAAPDHATQPKHASSLTPQRRSHNQTARLASTRA